MGDKFYKFPEYGFLEKSPIRNDVDNLFNKKEIEIFFQSFGIYVKCQDVFIGINSITYVVDLEMQTRISIIKSYKNDLLMRFNAIEVEFKPAIDGTPYLGIILIKEKNKTLLLGDLVDNQEFKETECKLPIVLGIDFYGKTCIEDLARLPHLLVAGTTGTGKSIFLSTLVTSFLYKFNPDELRLILVDTRGTNFPIFNGIPHLLTHVITDPQKSINALWYLIGVMNYRYTIFQDKNVDNIDDYNKVSEVKIPRIVLIIEDLCDLMLYTNKNVEDQIQELTQMSRAAGIHVIISTQRPSTNVVTGVIKANIPSRISFYVPSYIDSTTIIDDKGAEKLLLYGDMLFKKTGNNENKRIQTPYISDTEIEKIVNSISMNSEENYDKTCLEFISEEDDETEIIDGDLDDDIDIFLMDAIEYAIQQGQISASMIQRKFKLGYARSAKIIDKMEERGIISGYQGSKPRKVLLKQSSTDIIENEVKNIQLKSTEKINVDTKYNNIENDAGNEVKQERSILKKWWFWILTIIFILILIGNI